MGIAIKQNTDGSAGLQGSGGGDGQFVPMEFAYIASSVDSTVFVAQRAYIVKSVTCRPDVAGTDASAVTAVVKIAPSGTAIASGTAVHSGTMNLKGTVATNQAMTLSTTASDLVLAAGSAIGIDFTGVLTAAVGCISIELTPA